MGRASNGLAKTGAACESRRKRHNATSLLQTSVTQNRCSALKTVGQGTSRARITDKRLSLCPKPPLLGGARHSRPVTRQAADLRYSTIPEVREAGNHGESRGHDILPSTSRSSMLSTKSHNSDIDSRSRSSEDIRKRYSRLSSNNVCPEETNGALLHRPAAPKAFSPSERETPSADPVFEAPVMEDFISAVNTSVESLLSGISSRQDILTDDVTWLAEAWKERCRIDDQASSTGCPRVSKIALRLRPELASLHRSSLPADLNNNYVSCEDDQASSKHCQNIYSSAAESQQQLPLQSQGDHTVRAAVDAVAAHEEAERDFVLRLCSSSQGSSQDALQLLLMCDEDDSATENWISGPQQQEFRPHPLGLMTRPCSRLSPPLRSSEDPPAFWSGRSVDLLDSLETPQLAAGDASCPCFPCDPPSDLPFFGSSTGLL